MADMKFNDQEFEDVATTLWQINPSVRKHHADIRALIAYMKEETVKSMLEPGFWATFGFRVSVCRRAGYGQELYAAASLTVFGVQQYLTAKEG